MAKVTGPLMSVDASGSYAGTLTFSKWKGRNYVRQLVIPANPHSAGQEDARNRMRVSAAAQKWVNRTVLKETGATLTDLERIKSFTPAGYAWNGYLVQNMIGLGGDIFNASQAAYASLTAAEKTAWVDAAEALVPPMSEVPTTVDGGGVGVAITSGELFFIYRVGLFNVGVINTEPSGTPPTYA